MGSGSPSRRRPIRSESGDTAYDVRLSEVEHVAGDPVGARARTHAAAAPRAGGRGVSTRGAVHRSSGRPAARRRRATGGGPTRPRVSVEREPSTGSTAMPPADRDVGPQAATPGRPSRSVAARRQPDRRSELALRARRPSTSHGAPVTATQDGVVGGEREPAEQRPRGTAAVGSLPTSRLARAAAGRSSAPERGTPRWAQPGRPGPAPWSSGPAVAHLERHRPPRTSPACPGRAAPAAVAAGSHSTASVRPMIRHPPGDAVG